MTDWLEQYSAALDVRDAREKAHKQYIDAYTRLADRTASTPASATPAPPTRPTTSSPKPRTSNPQPTEDLTSLRADLTATQKARSQLTTTLATLQTDHTALQTTHKTALKDLATLQRTITSLERRLRDKESEVQGKARLAENAQDEMVALQLQLNLAEQKREQVEEENQQLVERWMKRVGEEAEKVNRDSSWE